jgi:hypothetical protein
MLSALRPPALTRVMVTGLLAIPVVVQPGASEPVAADPVTT